MTTKTTRIQEIRSFLKEWTNSKTSPHFAVMIGGGWGCGKTHFVKDLIDRKGKFTQRKMVYLSTFGLANSQALETSLFYASVSGVAKWAHRGAGLAGPLLSVPLAIGSGGLFGSSVNLDKVVKAATSQIEKSAKSLDGTLLILDDLERCKIPMAKFLGVINRYVEHGDTRVILVANTEKIDDDHFTLFREKVVGHSFLLESDPDDALASFIKEISDCRVRKVIKRKSDQICKLHNLSGYHNLRALRQFVWHLQGIVTKLDGKYRENEALVEKLIFEAFIFFVEFKLNLSEESKLLTPGDLLGTYDLKAPNVRRVYDFSSGDENKPTPKEKILSKYRAYGGIHTVVSVRLWIDILETGLVDEVKLNEEIAVLKEVAGLPACPSWKYLWHFAVLDFSDGSDKKFQAALADLNKRLDKGQYQHPAEFLHVAGVLLTLSEFGLHKASVPDTVQRLKDYVDSHLIRALTYEIYKPIKNDMQRFCTSHQGWEYMRRDRPEFQEIYSYLLPRMEDCYVERLKKDAGLELLGYLPEDPDRFIDSITLRAGATERCYLNEPILHTIDPEKFVDAWFSLQKIDEGSFIEYIKDRYIHFPSAMNLEGPWWHEVQQELKVRMDAQEIEPRAVQIRLLIDGINRFILEPSSKAGE